MSTCPEESPLRPTRTGRPYRPPEERVAPETSVVDRQARTAWLLGTTRMLAQGGRFAQRRDFVEALTDRGVGSDASRLSRWESGAQGVGTSVIAAYEGILGLRPYQLRGALDLVRSARTPAYGVVVGDDVDPYRRLDELLTAALHGHASGLEWLELAQRVAETDAVYLREGDWQTLTRTLVTEFCRSSSTGLAARTSALRLLIGYARAQRHLLLAIGEVILDERIARRAEPVHLFTRIPGRHANRLALRLAESDDTLVRTHATRTLAALVADGGFGDTDARLIETLVRLLRQDPGSFELADVAAQLPRAELEQVQAAVRSPALLQVVATREIVARETATACARQVTVVANPVSAQPRVEADGMLTRLIRDGLFHSHFRRRASALAVLAASQYAGRVGDGLVGLLGHRDRAVVASALEAMGSFVTAEHADVLAEVAASSRPASERRLALAALGHLPSEPSPRVLEAVVGCLSDPAGEVGRAAVAMLGMHGLADQATGVDPELDAAAQWWLEQGPRLTH